MHCNPVPTVHKAVIPLYPYPVSTSRIPYPVIPYPYRAAIATQVELITRASGRSGRGRDRKNAVFSTKDKHIPNQQELKLKIPIKL
jgi:hypothetical protein